MTFKLISMSLLKIISLKKLLAEQEAMYSVSRDSPPILEMEPKQQQQVGNISLVS